ncbi:uncharacterized protein LOC131285743 [Anopheles ziemanni]|uniref:uncharacterized protein LOC131268879 n=1 Tax=Anopheles coustani TaxID=139045 RepID=UPI0026595BBB|nr:uncharacterized protein LOC131268879 [Anopheles coustani]XP_058170583.1 uncharacterized protein LOC131285743 [Anopheles ziemanni]
MIEVNEFARLLLREARKEYQLILGRCNDFGFEYVIQRPPQARICFGSGIERETVPLRGPAMSSLMRRRQPKLLDNEPDPGKYPTGYDGSKPDEHPALRKRISKRGYGPLAATSVRFNFEEVSNSPGVGDYELRKERPPKQTAKPFGSGTDERRKDHSLPNPGVGTYRFKTRKDIRSHSFGGTIRITPAARTICRTENFDRCQRCDERPDVDYWKNLRTERCLCRRCMARELEEARCCSKNKSDQRKQLEALKEFKRVRHCAYYHRHDKTNAAIQFISNKQLKRKFRLENYLSMFE